jgi:hypothetical protein
MPKNINLRKSLLTLSALKTLPNQTREIKGLIRTMENRVGAALVKNMSVLPNSQVSTKKRGPGPKSVTMKRTGRFTVTGH